MTELEVSLNNLSHKFMKVEGEKKRKREARRRGKRASEWLILPNSNTEFRSFMHIPISYWQDSRYIQLTHNLCLNCVERVECAQFGNRAFFTFTTYVCVCAQLCITDSSACFAPFTLASFKLHFPSPDICCLSLLLQNIMIWWELCKSTFSAWDTHFSPNSLKTAEISTSVNSFQVWPLGN